MKVVSNEALTKLIQLVKSSFIKVDDIVQTQEVTLAEVATSGDYDDLINKPTIPTVNNATLTIQKNGSDVATFTANASSNVTANISVPTVDQTYSASSTNAQSGVAVASAISTKADSSTVSNINSRVTTIENEIPAQASSSNQLADKNFVNSSIATNTANFIGTFNSMAELEAYSGQKDDNDYAFVISTDAAGNTVYNRYKWNGSAWLFEYALNNSSFTANQWAAINSGATTTNIGQIATKADDNAVVHKTGNETITGVKTIENGIFLKDIQGTIGTTTNQWAKRIQFTDSTGARIARLEPRYVDATTLEMGMYASNGLENEAGIYVRSDGSTYAPTPSAGDNSTKIATTAFVGKAVSNTLSALYPVGSIYIGTQSTCPLATLISGSTWVKVATSLVTDVSIPSTLTVCGNGKTLGLTDGNYWYGISFGTNNAWAVRLSAWQSGGATVGASVSETSTTVNKALGVVEGVQSGLIAKTDSITYAKLTVNVWQRTA